LETWVPATVSRGVERENREDPAIAQGKNEPPARSFFRIRLRPADPRRPDAP
jgi:hypothetical protein